MNTNQVLQNPTSNLSLAYFWVTLSYILALALGFGVGYFYRESHIIVMLAMADIAATVVIFIFSYIFKNSSFYDPYWSVIPIFIAGAFIYLAVSEADLVRQIVVFLLVTAWGLRLTFNWWRGWTGLHHEDWRYVDLARQTGKAYWLVSFSGIHMFPTVMVFLGCIPLWSSLALNTTPFGILDALAALVTATAIFIEGTADNQLRKFRLSNTEKGKYLDKGLWAYSRHPNYFGEIMFWWGLFFFALAQSLDNWWMGAGALAITLMFVFISLPMIDKRMLERRNNYQEKMRRVSTLIPWFPKR
ncbi:MAG: DUF1295 domain-containing protein [Microscillaceae bacterium]|nr:DUF1295 domain-containing protein [Microscillaceae bacterium]